MQCWFFSLSQGLSVPIRTEEKCELRFLYHHNKANVYTRTSEFKRTFMSTYKPNFYIILFMYTNSYLVMKNPNIRAKNLRNSDSSVTSYT